MAIVLIAISLALIIFLSRYPKYLFWIFIVLLTDPSGHVIYYFNKASAGGIEANDVFFLIITLIFFVFGRFSFKEYFHYRDAAIIFRILFVFFLYRVFVYGLIVPPVEDLNEFFRFFIVRERSVLIAFLIIIPTYLIAVRNLEVFFQLIVIIGSIALILYPVSLVTGTEIIPNSSMLRYKGESVQRYFMMSYNAAFLILPYTLVVLITKIQLPLRKLLFVGGAFAALAMLIALTKGGYLMFFSMLLVGTFFTVKTLKINVNKALKRAVTIVIILFVVTWIFMPKYIGYSQRVLNDLFSIATEGTDEFGEEEGRMTTVVPAQLYMIKERPFFGSGVYGYKKNNLSDKFDMLAYDSTDVSIVGTLMQFGLVGMLIYYFFYYRLYLLIKKTYKVFKSINRTLIFENFKYEFIISIGSISYFIALVARVHNFTIELVNNSVFYYINVALLLACMERVEGKYKELKENDVNPKPEFVER